MEDCAEKHDIKLLQVFKLAKVPTNTYYRAKNGVDLRFDTASKVVKAISTISLSRKPFPY